MKHRVSLFCIGAQKAGTTTLHELLGMHPNVVTPVGKETKFFAHDETFAQGIDFYHRRFTWKPQTELAAEVDPEYIYFPEAIPRILEYNDEARFVVILRDPVERAHSHWVMSRARGFESLSFEASLDAEPSRLESGDWFTRVHFSYGDRGHYGRQLSRLLTFVPRERVLVLFNAQLRDAPTDLAARLFSFAGLAPLHLPERLPRSNPATKPRSRLLSSVLHRPGAHKTVAKALFGSDGRVANLVRRLKAFNLVPTRREAVGADARKTLLQRYAEDIHHLETLTSVALDRWRHP